MTVELLVVFACFVALFVAFAASLVADVRRLWRRASDHHSRVLHSDDDTATAEHA